MKRITPIIVGTGVMAAAFFAGRIFWPSVNTATETGETVTQNNFAPQTNDGGAVSIKITPQNSLNSNVWEFAVVFDTHSVELSEDPTKISLLIDGSGKEYEPIAWEGDAPGGHHRQGILKFNSLIPTPDAIKLKIIGVGGIQERLFVWKTGS